MVCINCCEPEECPRWYDASDVKMRDIGFQHVKGDQDRLTFYSGKWYIFACKNCRAGINQGWWSRAWWVKEIRRQDAPGRPSGSFVVTTLAICVAAFAILWQAPCFRH